MPRPMKLWELMSAFRQWPDALREVLASDAWRGEYLALLERYGDLVRHQNRDILDAPVPIELSRTVAARCPARFALEEGKQQLRQAAAGESASVGISILTAAEVHDLFGGSLIEEVFEYGAAGLPRCPPAALGRCDPQAPGNQHDRAAAIKNRGDFDGPIGTAATRSA